MQTVILDTNALLMPFERRLNIDLEVQRLLGNVRMVIPEPLLGELRRSHNKYATAALALAAKYETLPTDSRGDDAVLELAVRLQAPVLTNDKQLRARLRMQGIPLIYLRSGSHLILER
ncbi:MAG: PIN domain-containing protein [Candidatus Methanomethylophilaceae archaeon]|jgi:rRNA-processing protein FCF1